MAACATIAIKEGFKMIVVLSRALPVPLGSFLQQKELPAVHCALLENFHSLRLEFAMPVAKDDTLLLLALNHAALAP